MAVSTGLKGQQQNEYLLFGSVSDAHHGALLHRLRGLCDFATTGGVPFCDRELTYQISAGTAMSRVKVRQSMDLPQAPWYLAYTGQLELGDAHRLSAVRTSVYSSCSQNLMDCLKELGFIVVSELILRGHLFRKGQMKVSVFKLYQPGESGDLESAQAVSDHYLVELSAIAPSGQENVGGELKSFADQLKPIVAMEKTDGLR